MKLDQGVSSINQEKNFWQNIEKYSDYYIHYDSNEYRFIVNLLEAAPIKGKQVLEIGCGAGVWTANLSGLGAFVYHFDLSPTIVLSARRFAASERAQGFCADMNYLPFTEGVFDLIFGSMVLHHASDHTWLGRELCRVLKPGGKAIFHENSSRNPILMLARGTLVGRWGIPKNSSPGEHPLRPSEIVQVGNAFELTNTYHARMFFFQMAVKYLFKRETGVLHRFSGSMDNCLYRWIPGSRPLSYYQILEFRKHGSGSLG